MLHGDRARAESFGDDADLYDRARPRYPAEMVEVLLAMGAPADGDAPGVLDVGAGTGIVGRMFADRRAEVLGIEPDDRMAAVARGKGLTVESGHFEEWDAGGRRFDLVVSGQAWHWVDPVSGSQKASTVLREGGAVGLFWNRGILPAGLRQAWEATYARLAPGLESYSVILGNGIDERLETTAGALRSNGSFGDVRIERFGHAMTYTTAQWLDHLRTHSDHRALEPGRRAELLEAVAEPVERLGGSFVLTYETDVVMARRLPDRAGRPPSPPLAGPG